MGTTSPVRQLQIEQLAVEVYGSREEMGKAAAVVAQEVLHEAIASRGEANVILATGNSQLSFLHALRELPGIAWEKIRVFHMDEYLGLAPTHPASFPRFLHEHILNKVKPGQFFPVPGQPVDVSEACRTYEALLHQYPADLTALGFGENGHLAFNDPPYAKFDDPNWVKVVQLDDASRKQQVGEGHFPSLDAVPTHAITLTIPALLAAKRVLAIVPEKRKVQAVHSCLYEPISEDRPGSILRRSPHATLYLDPDSAAGLES